MSIKLTQIAEKEVLKTIGIDNISDVIDMEFAPVDEENDSERDKRLGPNFHS